MQGLHIMTCPVCKTTYEGSLRSKRCGDCSEKHRREYQRNKARERSVRLGSVDVPCFRCGGKITKKVVSIEQAKGPRLCNKCAYTNWNYKRIPYRIPIKTVK